MPEDSPLNIEYILNGFILTEPTLMLCRIRKRPNGIGFLMCMKLF